MKSEQCGRDVCFWYADLLYRLLCSFWCMPVAWSYGGVLWLGQTHANGYPSRGMALAVLEVAFHHAGPQKAAARTPLFLSLLYFSFPMCIPYCGKAAERNQLKELLNHGPLTWEGSSRFCMLFFFNFHSNSIPNFSPFRRYSLFSMLLLCTKLFYPILFWPLFMQII